MILAGYGRAGYRPSAQIAPPPSPPTEQASASEAAERRMAKHVPSIRFSIGSGSTTIESAGNTLGSDARHSWIFVGGSRLGSQQPALRGCLAVRAGIAKLMPALHCCQASGGRRNPLAAVDRPPMQASLLANHAAGRLRLVRLYAMGLRDFLPLPEPPTRCPRGTRHPAFLARQETPAPPILR